MPNPDASSTPSNPVLRGRKGIHEMIDTQNISSTSPIQKSTPEDYFGQQQIISELEGSQSSSQSENDEPNRNRPHNISSENVPERSPYNSEDEYSDSQSSVEQPRETNVSQDSPSNEIGSNSYKYWFIIAVLAILVMALIHVGQENEETLENNPYNFTEDFKRVQKLFNKQEEDFWPSIRVGIEEILKLNQPRSIIFLYENDSMAIAKNIIANVSKAAVCHLSHCSQEPINIEGSSLTKIQDDFGIIVSNYREKLENSGVFIIHNLHLVPGKSAQAFHLFCDDYNPVVNRALFLFTVKVDELPDKYTATSFLESLLRKAWNDIGVDDKFDPLFTRISGTVLPVRP